MPIDRLTVFWVAMAASVVLFAIGLSLKVSFWSRGYVRDAQGRPVQGRKAWAALQTGVRGIFGRRFTSVIRTFVLDGLLHRELYHEDRYRWAAHFLMLFGFLALFTLSTITGFFEEVLHLMFRSDTPLVQFITNKDTPLMALLNEVLGLVIVAGLIMVLVRRFVLRPAQLRTSPFDVSTIVLLALIMFSAYPTESFRLLMEDTPPALAWYSFIGYPLALLIKPLNLNWVAWHYWTFMLHIGAAIILLVTLPFSKFFHVLISPIIATANRQARLRHETEVLS